MMGFDDAASMGMGMINAGIQAGMATGQFRRQKKLQELQKGVERRGTQAELAGIAQEGQQAQHQAGMQEAANAGDANDRGVAGGSIPAGANTEVEYQKGQRLQALSRQRDLITANQIDQEKMWNIQREMSRAQRQMQLISSFMQQGGGGALQTAGGQF
jgi:hypothetical protein